MKKINEQRAKELIITGNYPKCKVAKETYVIVDSLAKLENLKRLSSLQGYELYEDNTPAITLPENACELSIDDAITLLSDNEPICCIRDGEVKKISTYNELIEIIRSCSVRGGEQYVLYWSVD